MDKVMQLIDKSKENGNKLFMSEIIAFNLSDEESDELFKQLSENKIKVVDIETEAQNIDTNLKSEYYNQNLYEQYMNEINRIPLLTLEEEIELGYDLKSSDAKVVARARKKMIESNLRLAASIARDIYWKNKTIRLELLDLIQEANIGLQKAINKYDVTLVINSQHMQLGGLGKPYCAP